MNNWKAIWNRREADECFLQSLEDPKAIWRELKRIDGFYVDLGDSAAQEQPYIYFPGRIKRLVELIIPDRVQILQKLY